MDKKKSAKVDDLKTVIWELGIIEGEKAVFNVIISTVQNRTVASYFNEDNNQDSN